MIMVLQVAFYDLFKSGSLELPTTPEEILPVEGLPAFTTAMVIVFVMLSLLFMRNFLNILPYLADNFMRARGSAALEESVRVSRDRNLIALILIIPFCLLINRFLLYRPEFASSFGENVRPLAVFGVFILYLLLRLAMYFLLMPRRMRTDNYQLSRKCAFTFFITMNLVMLTTAGLMILLGAGDRAVGVVLAVELFTIYAVMLFRRTQILSGSFSPLTVFLYLCGLELLPTGLIIASAIWF